MQLSSLLALLALTGSSLANPVQQRTPGLQIQDFWAQRSDTAGKLHFNVRDESGLGDNCTVHWDPKGDVQPGLVPMTTCDQKNFQFGFRYGIGNIKNFMLAVKKVGSESQAAYKQISAPQARTQQDTSGWACSESQGTVDCAYKGTLEMAS